DFARRPDRSDPPACSLSLRRRFGGRFAPPRRCPAAPSTALQRYQMDEDDLAFRHQADGCVEIVNLAVVEQHNESATLETCDGAIDLRLYIQRLGPAAPIQPDGIE